MHVIVVCVLLNYPKHTFTLQEYFPSHSTIPRIHTGSALIYVIGEHTYLPVHVAGISLCNIYIPVKHQTNIVMVVKQDNQLLCTCML